MLFIPLSGIKDSSPVEKMRLKMLCGKYIIKKFHIKKLKQGSIFVRLYFKHSSFCFIFVFIASGRRAGVVYHIQVCQ